jgi:hypothetical protein
MSYCTPVKVFFIEIDLSLNKKHLRVHVCYVALYFAAVVLNTRNIVVLSCTKYIFYILFKFFNLAMRAV